jgi:hypothetical protein
MELLVGMRMHSTMSSMGLMRAMRLVSLERLMGLVPVHWRRGGWLSIWASHGSSMVPGNQDRSSWDGRHMSTWDSFSI